MYNNKGTCGRVEGCGWAVGRAGGWVGYFGGGVYILEEYLR
jgi:hypothetical protein